MILSDLSIKRPVFASVLSLLLVAFGVVSFERLSLREYPDIDPPVVTVEVGYPGAPASVVETRVTRLLEERIAGIEGIEFIESSSSDGESQVTIQFSVNRDIDAAANDVRDRISGIADNLPQEADPPEVQQADSNDDVIIWQNLVSDRLSVPELTDYAERYLVDQFATVDGVARVRVGGGLTYALRIWVDPAALAARNLTVLDVEDALRANNVEVPAGSVDSQTMLFQARVTRPLQTPEDFTRLVVGRTATGSEIRLGDVARVEKGVEEERTLFRGNGIPMVGIGIIKQSTANTIDVAREVRALSARLNTGLPEGMNIEASYDSSVFIEASIAEVYKTLLFAIVCVVAVIYLFLGTVRATLVPAVTVPVSIVATFIAVYAFGFSINLLTLLALVLAIGLVVDDAIVMLENIVRRMQEKNETPLVAAYRGAHQVGFAVVATTLVLIAVFVPLTFLQGDIGRLFTEFALTLAAAVGFSSIVALSLSPMLASQILKQQQRTKAGRVQRSGVAAHVAWAVRAVRRRYVRVLVRLMRRMHWGVVGFAAAAVASVGIYFLIPQEFVPQEDRGVIFGIVNGPEGATFDYMADYMDAIEQRLMPLVEQGDIDRLLVRAPRGFGNIANFNGGIVIIVLNHWGERRPGPDVIADIQSRVRDLPGIRFFANMRQGLGGGTGKPVQFVIGGPTYEQLAAWRDALLPQIEAQLPGLVGVDSDYKQTRPQIDFVPNFEQAAALGVTTSDIGRTLESILGGRRVTTYLERGEEYDVIVEGERQTHAPLQAVEGLFVRAASTGALVPLPNLVEIESYGAAQTLSRYNRVRAITVEANLAEGYRLGTALNELEALARQTLPEEAVFDYKGQSRDFVTSGQSILFVFVLGLLVVFLVLAAQFESYVHPLVIMLTVPVTAGGGLLGLWLTGLSLNIYSQIGLVMLVGLAAKNGILIVEFANQLRDEGMHFTRAILEACRTRFRPIVMTSLTTMAGVVPLILASGAGAETRIVIGVVVLFGVGASLLATLFVVPVAYALLARGTGSPQAVAQRLAQEQHAPR